MKFRGHETFSIRKGWLSKGIKRVNENSSLFSEKGTSPMDVLGIGSNMVKSLKYWLLAVGLTKTDKGKQELTELGRLVLEADPYIEELGTLWMLHYQLVKQKDTATSWYFFFNQFKLSEFSKDDFTKALSNYAKMQGEDPSIRALDEDFNCILNTYIPRYKTAPDKDEPESNMECPLSELGLIDFQNRKKKTYRKCVPAAHTIDPLIVVAVLIDNAAGRKEIPISEIQNAEMNVGKVFNLDTITLLAVLHEAERFGLINVVRTAGLDVVKIKTSYSFLECIKQYYARLS